MTRDDIIRMARGAGWKDLREFDSEMHDDIFMGKIADLERFAALVAAAEREACAKVCREIGEEHPPHVQYSIRAIAKECAAAIRARGQ